MKMTDRQDVNMGVMSKVEYRMKWYNEDENTATQKIEEMDIFNIPEEEEVVEEEV